MEGRTCVFSNRGETAQGIGFMGEDSTMQSSYRLSEIGLLTAGLMHEIKNPLGFVHSNLDTLAKYADRCREVFEAYAALEEAASESPELADALANVRRARERTRFDLVLEDLRPVIDHSVFGSTHMIEIIAAVGSVARGHGAVPAKASIEDCLERALFLASHEIKERVEIRREFDDLEDVECRAGQICQVFLNLVVNAAHAIEGQGRITLRTRQEGDRIIVEIEDNGCGMSDEVREQIFSPFFSTKEEGRGTGLGLALTIEIVREHGGDLEVESTPGEGSLFRVLLPRNQEGGAGCRS
jgi:two-component system NtrC family sensor kinase